MEAAESQRRDKLRSQITVTPQQTSTYTLVAYCGNNTSEASVTITVNAAPTPTPTQPSQPSEVLNVTPHQTGSQQFVLDVQYTWNGEQAPARIEAYGINKDGKVVTPTGSAAVSSGGFRNVNVPVGVYGNRTVVQWQACLVGQGGNDLSCKSVPQPKYD
jgi:hypothetical protein